MNVQMAVTLRLNPGQRAAEGVSGQRAYRAKRDVWDAERAIAGFYEYAGEQSGDLRRLHIRDLPWKLWHGRVVFKVTCYECGQVRWFPESLLWRVISLKHVICPWCLCYGCKKGGKGD